MTTRNRDKPLRPTAHCLVCGSRFRPRRRDARFCSARCRQRSHRAARDPAALKIDQEIEAARRLYWRLIRTKAEGLKLTTSQVLTEEAQFVDEQGNVFRGDPSKPMHFVGRCAPPRPGWSVWGLEAAQPPFCAPPSAPPRKATAKGLASDRRRPR